MPETLKPLSIDKALLATRESMAVKREIAHLLTAKITDQNNVISYEADLGTFLSGTSFTFSLSNVLGETTLHFEDLQVVLKPGNAAVRHTVKVSNSGENAISLVTECDTEHKWHFDLAVDAEGAGRIIDKKFDNSDPSAPQKMVFIWRFRVVAQRKMVQWFDPPLLLRTTIEVLVSTIFGGHSDYRLIEALAVGNDAPHDYTKHYLEEADGQYLRGEDDKLVVDETKPDREEIWFDYVADTGDGWNPTYSIAYYLAQPELTLRDGSQTYQTKRGELLVFGGDQVYPLANRKEYKERLVEPFRTALRYSDRPHPDVFAIPGNHDWYDSLVSFTRLFCSRRWFNGWRAPQRRSYFALRLPQNWWLLGIDIQLRSDLDQAQIEYFKHVAKLMRDGDRVILCTAEPHWLQTKVFEKYGMEYNESNLAFLENNVLGRRVSVFLSGDLHYYRRHEAKDGTQKIVSGGGGAALTPTHADDVDELRGGFRLKSSFPDETTSRRLIWRNVFFLFYNARFGLLTAILYFLTSWAVMADIGKLGIHNIVSAFNTTVNTAVVQAGAVFWILFILIAFVAFTNTKSKAYQWIAGLIHGWVQLMAVFLIGWGATYFTVTGLGLRFQSPLQLVIAALMIFAGGWIVGSFLTGVFLLISLNVFGCLQIAASSSLRLEDWKNFLRIRIDRDGKVTIFPIGVKRVPRKWRRPAPGSPGPELIPNDPNATPPQLIEPPIVVKF
jgi:hypothetical protein